MKTLNQPIKIIFFDIDETLYIKKNQSIPRSITEQVLPQLRAKGIIPAIATGRTLAAFPDAIQPLMNEQGFELLVTTNGQYNLYQGKVISKYCLDRTRVEQAVQKLKALHIEYAFVCAEQIAVSKNSLEVETALSPITTRYIVDSDHYLTHDVIQLLAFYPPERVEEVLAAGILGGDLKEVRWHPLSVDLLVHGNSKAVGIRDVVNYFDIGMEQTMAFGDGLNDLEMLAEVGFGVAMGNAEPELKAVADYVTLPIDEDGILVALKSLNVL